jgi:hypothetical protein
MRIVSPVIRDVALEARNPTAIGSRAKMSACVEFKAVQYKRRGKVIATAEQLQRIAKVPKREFICREINQHTLEKICGKEPVRASKLAKVLKVLQQWESEQRVNTMKRTTSTPLNTNAVRRVGARCLSDQ